MDPTFVKAYLRKANVLKAMGQVNNPLFLFLETHVHLQLIPSDSDSEKIITTQSAEQ